MTNDLNNLLLLSRISDSGQVELRLGVQPLPALERGELLIRMIAAPINPSDVGLMLASADLATVKVTGEGAGLRLTAELAKQNTRPFAGRIGRSLPLGNEGMGIVVDAAPELSHMVGRKVAMLGGAMYARYRIIQTTDCMVLPDEATPAQGAGLFVNPLTALCMTEVLRREGHKALVHTAAASNLGQMLLKICQLDGIDLVNIVRREEQAILLRELGATHVVNSSSETFRRDLADAIAETGATLAFEAIGGGRMANALLHAMEAASLHSGEDYSLYGSATHKQVYIYGSLDLGETPLDRGYGMSWGVAGFLVLRQLNVLEPERRQALLDRILPTYDTTFASAYTATIGLEDLFDPAILRSVSRPSTGEKYLLDLKDHP